MRKLLVAFLALFLISASTSERKIRILLAGDSTVQKNDLTKKTDVGWGMMLPMFFDQNVEVVNYAIGGRSTRSFIAEGRWAKLIANAQQGDYVLIQFGHNDAAKDKPERYCVPDDYEANLVRMVNDVKSVGAIPVLITSTPNRKFKNGELILSQHSEYIPRVRKVALEQEVMLVDLFEKGIKALQQKGDEPSKQWYNYVPKGHSIFPDGKADDVHFSPEGGRVMASLVMEGIRELGIKELVNRMKKVEINNRYGFVLLPQEDGTYRLSDEKQIAPLVDIAALSDFRTPYTYSSNRLPERDYNTCKTVRFTYKKYPTYSLDMEVDLAVSDRPAPFVVYIHGGGWARGNASSSTDISQYCAVQGGMAGIRINYTLSDKAGGSILLAMEDVKDAVRFVQSRAKELNLDPNRFAFCGGSAGGHLSAISAMTMPGTKALVAYAGVFDLLKTSALYQQAKSERVRYFLDRKPEVMRRASAAYNIPQNNIPSVLLIHGTGDFVVEPSQSESFAKELTHRGAQEVVLKLYPNYSHNISSKKCDVRDDVFLITFNFLKKNLYSDSSFL